MTDAAIVTALSRVFSDYVARTVPSLVSIRSGRAGITGFIWRPGLIVTAEEALPEEDAFAVVTASGETVSAQRAGRDPSTDITLLRLERADLSPIALATSQVAAGSLALVVGTDDGTPSAALGVVSRSSGAWRSLRGGEIDARLELDARIRRSAEGGLVLDAAGQAFGMAVFGPRRRTLVVPSATIERVASTLATHGRIARGYLGLGMQPVAVDGGNRSGIMVMSVDAQGPGAAAGLHQGDIILACNGDPIGHVRALRRKLGPVSIGQTVTLEVSRGGKIRPVQVTVGERQAG